MKDWVVSAGLAIAALLLFWALLFPKLGASEQPVPLPVSTERAAAGYLGLDHWLTAEGVHVVRWRERFEKLVGPRPRNAERRGGDVLITTMPHSTAVRRAELEQLDSWIKEGNTLVVMAALADTPRWSILAPTSNFDAQVTRLTRLKISVVAAPEDDDADKARAALTAALAPALISLTPIETATGPHPLFAGVGTVSAKSELPASRWRAEPMDANPVLELAKRGDNGDPAVWLKPFGAGAVILSAFASPFSNEKLGDAGNARWLANILAYSLRPGGRVLIDDAHQGAVDFYDPQAFFADPRLHHALWWIVLVWFLYVVGAPHLRGAEDRPAAVDDAAMLRVTARFYASALSAPTAGARLIEHFFNAIRRRRSLREDGTPVWDWLEAQARVPADDLAELRVFHERAAAGRNINLLRLQTLLTNVTGHLA